MPEPAGKPAEPESAIDRASRAIERYRDPMQTPGHSALQVTIAGTDGTGESGIWQRSWKHFAETHEAGYGSGAVMRAMAFAKDLGLEHEQWSLSLSAAIFARTEAGKRLEDTLNKSAAVTGVRHLRRERGTIVPAQPDLLREEVAQENSRQRDNENGTIEQAVEAWHAADPDNGVHDMRALCDVTRHAATLGKHVAMLGMLEQQEETVRAGIEVMDAAIERGRNSLLRHPENNLDELRQIWQDGNAQTDPAHQGPARARYVNALCNTFPPPPRHEGAAAYFAAEAAVAHDLHQTTERIHCRNHSLQQANELAFDCRYRERLPDCAAERAIAAVSTGDGASAAAAYMGMARLAADIAELDERATAQEVELRDITARTSTQLREAISGQANDDTDPSELARATRQQARELTEADGELDRHLRQTVEQQLNRAAESAGRGLGDPRSTDLGGGYNLAAGAIRRAAEAAAVREFGQGRR